MKANTGDLVLKYIGLAVIVLILAFCVYAYNFLLQWKEEEVDTGPTKDARQNQFLAAELFLKELEAKTQVSRNFSTFDNMQYDQEVIGEFDTIILIDSRGAIKGERFKSLWHWVEDGGNLIASTNNPFIGENTEDLLMQSLEIELLEAPETIDILSGSDSPIDNDPPPSHLQNDDQVTDSSDARQNQRTASEFTFNFSDDTWHCDETTPLTEVRFSDEDEVLEIDFDTNHYLNYYGQEPEGWIANDNGIAVAYFEIGEGSVYLTLDNTIWNNTNIQCFDHAHFLRRLINTEGKVWFFVNSESPSLITIIWRATPIAVISAFCALLLWLWQSAIRFGPIFYPANLARRSFAEHIHANAVFLWRTQQQGYLIRQLRHEITNKLSRRDKQFVVISDDEKTNYISEITSLERDDIHQAMFQPITNDKHEFLVATKKLKEIKEKL